MSSQRYERASPPFTRDLSRRQPTSMTYPCRYTNLSPQVNAQDEDDTSLSSKPLSRHNTVPNSPPPSFRSHASSRRQSLSSQDLLRAANDRTLEDAFDDGSDDDEGEGDGRQRLMRGQRTPTHTPPSSGSPDQASRSQTNNEGGQTTRPAVERRVTQLPIFATPPSTATPGGRVYGGGSSDGVFANLSAKPTRAGEDTAEEKPPSYEHAALTAPPPYFETPTIFAPSGPYGTNEVYLDGLPIG